MIQWINKKTGEVYNRQNIKVGKDFIINPTEETLSECGYTKVEIPEDKLKDAIEAKVTEILAYNDSNAVNEFTLDGAPTWVDLEKRLPIHRDIVLDIEKGKEESTIWLNGHKMVLNSQLALKLINAIESYAYEAHNATQTHLFNVRGLKSVEAVEKYDYTVNYPQKLNLKTK
mgnify:CR=1 FL=1|jgi:hypothetical protein|nr:MAG TPA: hypothetical protein [Caudoviricetes sp.]